jgi:hypothetical protein
MKTKRDLALMARQDIGWAPNTQEYIDWLEEKLLEYMNVYIPPLKKPQSVFDNQIAALSKKQHKGPLMRHPV